MLYSFFRLWIYTLIVIFFVGFQLSCGAGGNNGDGANDLERPEGWTEVSHGPDRAASYDVVFPQDRVNRIDVTISPEDWKAMLDDITELHGAFGASSFSIPPIAYDACEGLNSGDTCAFGTCLYPPCGGTGLACKPDDIDVGLPDPPAEGSDLHFSDQDPIWVPCTVNFEGKSWFYVGVRFKGNSTLKFGWGCGNYKVPLKFDFDEFEDQYPEILNQRFYGFKRLALANNGLDASYLHEKVGGDLFREGGVPAPRRVFVRIYIDFGEGPVYFGLYTMAEVPDDPMFTTQLGGTGGNLYKPDFGAANWQAGLPVNEQSFPKKTNETEADWSDVERAIEALHGPRENAAAWRDELEARFDVYGFLKWLAINTVIQDWDTYGNLAHNYYLYGDPGQNGRLLWIPWDHNMCLDDQMGLKPPIALDMSDVSEDWPLIYFLIRDPVYLWAYWGYVNEFVQGVFEAESIKARLQREHDLIAPYVVGPEGEQPEYTVLPSPQAFESSLQELFNHVDERHEAVNTVFGR
ncbi:MAG: cellulosomal protein [FCB group bacterium]|nr:cellulosomal protein [FCB group bacterium]